MAFPRSSPQPLTPLGPLPPLAAPLPSYSMPCVRGSCAWCKHALCKRARPGACFRRFRRRGLPLDSHAAHPAAGAAVGQTGRHRGWAPALVPGWQRLQQQVARDIGEVRVPQQGRRWVRVRPGVADRDHKPTRMCGAAYNRGRMHPAAMRAACCVLWRAGRCRCGTPAGGGTRMHGCTGC